eukprot:COSAG02_NODE_1025_length_15146_cov_21.959460_12_plen_53_part_00
MVWVLVQNSPREQPLGSRAMSMFLLFLIPKGGVPLAAMGLRFKTESHGDCLG